MCDPNLAVMAVTYLLPICYMTGLANGLSQESGIPVPLSLRVWTAFWPAIIAVIVWDGIRQALRHD